MKTKNLLLTALLLIFMATTATAVAPYVTVTAPVSGSTEAGTDLEIDLNCSDFDTNTLNILADINYSATQTQGSGTNIITDHNLAETIVCDSNGLNAPAGVSCTYDWNTAGVPANCYVLAGSSPVVTYCDYYLNASLQDAVDTNYATGATTFRITSTSDVDVNLSNFGNLINNATTLTDFVIEGVKEQGGLIGLAIGLSIAVGLLFALIFTIVNFLPKLTQRIKGLK